MAATLPKNALERDLSMVLGKSVLLSSVEAALLDPASLKRAYHRRAHEFHPDKAVIRGVDPDYLAERFKALSEAYLRVLAHWETGGGFTPKPAAGSASRETRKTYQGAGPRPTASPRPNANPRPEAHPNSFSARVYHPGRIPTTRLRFAQFLYYSKRIDWETLIKAISWQFRARAKLGEIGIELGYLSDSDISFIFSNRKPDELFGAAALRLGLVDRYRLSVLLGRQRLLDLPIGRFFVENGHLSPSELPLWLDALYRHNLAQAAGTIRAAGRR